MKRLRDLLDTGIVVRVTNLGLGFVLTTLVVAIGATNTGNNGLYVLLSLFLAALVVSGILSRWNVEGIVPELEGPDEVFAGEPTRFTVSLTNRARRARRAILLKIGGATHPLLFAVVEGGGRAARGVDLVFSRRGVRRVEPLLVYSGWPIGLFRKGRRHASSIERLVYPNPFPPTPSEPDRRRSEGDAAPALRHGRGFDVRALRAGEPGDDPRDVHWPQTARQGTLIVRERAADTGSDSIVHLAGPSEPGPAFEESVSRAAGLVLHLLSRGDRVGLLVGSRLVPPAAGPVHRRSLLAALAVVEAKETAAAAGDAPGAAPYRRSAVYRVPS